VRRALSLVQNRHAREAQLYFKQQTRDAGGGKAKTKNKSGGRALKTYKKTGAQKQKRRRKGSSQQRSDDDDYDDEGDEEEESSLHPAPFSVLSLNASRFASRPSDLLLEIHTHLLTNTESTDQHHYHHQQHQQHSQAMMAAAAANNGEVSPTSTPLALSPAQVMEDLNRYFVGPDRGSGGSGGDLVYAKNHRYIRRATRNLHTTVEDGRTQVLRFLSWFWLWTRLTTFSHKAGVAAAKGQKWLRVCSGGQMPRTLRPRPRRHLPPRNPPVLA